MKIEDDKSVEELEGYMQGNAMGSFVHLHFGSNPTVALAFVERCRYLYSDASLLFPLFLIQIKCKKEN